VSVTTPQDRNSWRAFFVRGGTGAGVMAGQRAKRQAEGATHSQREKALSMERSRRLKKIGDGIAPIRADEAYQIDLFQERVGLGDNALRRAERAGLKVVCVGVQRQIRGAEWLRYLAALETAGGDQPAGVGTSHTKGGRDAGADVTVASFPTCSGLPSAESVFADRPT